MCIYINTFGNRLSTLRLEKGLTQLEFALKFKKTNSAISSYESRGRFPDEKLLKEIAMFFNVSLDYLLGTSNIRSPAEILDPIIIDQDTKNFTNKLVNELLKQGMITDIENIPAEITDMIIAALKTDLKRIKKETK